MRRLLAAPLATLALLAAAPSALGCSCAGPREPRAALAAADGAAVVTVLERRDTPPDEQGRTSSGDPTVLVARVDRAYKGNLDETVEIHTVRSGATCGLDAQAGQQLALYLGRREGRWTSGTCQLTTAAELEEGSRPWPAPRRGGPARVLVGGSYGDRRVIAVDGAGRVVGYGRGGGTTIDLAPCPGGRQVAELATPPDGGQPRVLLRDVRTLRARGLPSPLRAGERVRQVGCAVGGRVVALTLRVQAGQDVGRLVVRSGRRWRTLAASTGPWLAVAGSRAAVLGAGALVVDVRTGRRLATRTAGVRAVGPAAISPRGRRLAVLRRDGVVLLDGRTLRTLRASGPARAVAFADDRTLAAVSAGGVLRLVTLDLDPLRTLGGVEAAALAGGEGGAAALAERRVLVLRRDGARRVPLPVRHGFAVAVLPPRSSSAAVACAG